MQLFFQKIFTPTVDLFDLEKFILNLNMLISGAFHRSCFMEEV